MNNGGRKRRELPTLAKIPGVKFDIEKLREEAKRMSEKWANVYQANRGLCAVHEELAADNYHHFDQITLTYFEESLNEMEDITQLKQECKLIASSDSLGETKHAKYRTKTRVLDGLPAPMNEHNWHHPLPIYEGSYIQQAIESQFKATPIRVRLTRIRAGSPGLSKHMDYDTVYAIRVIVPIDGTDGVYNHFWRQGEKKTFAMEPDGSAYFLNVGFAHAVEHTGNEDRIALMFSLPTQEDIADLGLDDDIPQINQ